VNKIPSGREVTPVRLSARQRSFSQHFAVCVRRRAINRQCACATRNVPEEDDDDGDGVGLRRAQAPTVTAPRIAAGAWAQRSRQSGSDVGQSTTVYDCEAGGRGRRSSQSLTLRSSRLEEQQTISVSARIRLALFARR
jgi:hypothetical protein